jgi:hypothetical protein
MNIVRYVNFVHKRSFTFLIHCLPSIAPLKIFLVDFEACHESNSWTGISPRQPMTTVKSLCLRILSIKKGLLAEIQLCLWLTSHPCTTSSDLAPQHLCKARSTPTFVRSSTSLHFLIPLQVRASCLSRNLKLRTICYRGLVSSTALMPILVYHCSTSPGDTVLRVSRPQSRPLLWMMSGNQYLISNSHQYLTLRSLRLLRKLFQYCYLPPLSHLFF